jgi:hypothetical protein
MADEFQASRLLLQFMLHDGGGKREIKKKNTCVL